MHRSLLIISLFAVLAFPASGRELAVSRALQANAGMRADFVQKFTPAGFTRERVERGEVVFGPAPKMRWSYEDPEEKTFVFDGTTSWLYAPADRQVTVARLGETERKGLPFVLLSDPAALQASYAVAERRDGSVVRTELRPKSGDALVRDLVIVTGATDGRIRRIEYADAQGNRTVFEFSGYRRASVDANTFTFTPPAGVDVVRQ
ncbi:MAG: outer membrane lipoprotein chaperone LolA [Thermoanaerobaculia bacterium]